MKKRLILPGAALLILIAAVLVAAFARRPVTITVDGASQLVETRALNVGWALKDSGIPLTELDEITPPLAENLPWNGAVIEILRPRPVSVWVDGGGLLKTWWSTDRVPTDLLAAAGVTLAKTDQLLWNGAPVAPEQALPLADEYLLQVRRAGQASILINAEQKNIATLGPTLGQALWVLGLRLTPLDELSLPFDTPLSKAQTLTVRPAVPVRVAVDGTQISGRSPAQTVGQALAQVGVSLQGLDYAVPAADQPLPADGRVRVVRVREEIELQQTSIPYKSEFVADPNTELDQVSIVQAGQAGVKLARVRVRYEDSKEVSRQKEAEWVASQPRNQKTGYGTKIVIRTLDTPDGKIEYYRKVTVYATSYAPCNFIQFIGHCSYTTAAGYPLQKGVIGVGEAWYNLMKGWGVYVDGYGPARVGDYGYVPGFWVDLGYSDADFINWHRNTTLYFLTPVPANVPWVLPK
jgi:uncharacterized protein YabE (DUF348 family)